MIKKVIGGAIIILAVVIAAFAFNLPQRLTGHGDQGGAGDEQQLKDSLRQWDEAYARRDGEALNQILAREFSFTSPTGQVVNRSLYLSANLKAPDIAIETPINSDDVQVHVYGGTAVVTSVAAQRGQRFNRDPKVRYRYTDVWVKRGGRWQAVASQATRIGDATGPI